MAEKTTRKKATPKAAADKPLLTLTDLRPAAGSVRARKRVGRGRATGVGKTSGRGHNGEGQRSGQSQKRGFEGGQMPGYRQMPKINGFTMVNRKKWLELNLQDLGRILLAEENELNPDILIERGLLKRQHDGVRILGNGNVEKKVQIKAHHVSASARQKIEAAGGTVEIL